MKIAAIDPGLAGAIAVIDSTRLPPILIAAIDLPVHGEGAKRRIDVTALIRWLQQYDPISVVFVERAGSFPDQGIASAFNYGRAVGAIEATILSQFIPLHIVEASAWKKHYNLGRDKEVSRQLALQRFPGMGELFARRKDHQRAEAALLACYGATLLQFGVQKRNAAA